MAEDDGLVCAYLQPPQGTWTEIGWEEVRAWTPKAGLLWVHLDRTAERTKAYLHGESGLDPLVAENLLAEETRPRALEIDGNLLVSLRGVNLNPNADPDDMVSLRLWLTPSYIITARHRRIMAISDMRERIEKGRGPQTAGDFLVEVAGRLVDRMSPVIEDLDEAENDIEDRVVAGDHKDSRSQLGALRREAIGLRRYLAPQREAMSRIQGEPISWLDPRQKARLREISDRILRYIEDLDAIRERAAVIQDEVANRVAEEMNKNMYMLAIVATVLLPLGFVTGLLGINVDGMPGSKETPWAFWAVTGFLGLFVAVEIYLMRKFKWF
ncbi:MAG: zinc transporter ZntB [Rhodospirillales bacterium]